MRIRSLAIIVAAAACGGCETPPPETSFASNDPSARTRAIAKATRERDQSAVPDLIELLDSDDPAIRMLSIGALEDLTSRRFGYDHAAPRLERLKSIETWERWWRWTQDPGSGPEPGI